MKLFEKRITVIMVERRATITITKEQLDNILKKHTPWVENESGGERADLRGAYLSGADLYGADLRGADLSGAKNISLPIACPEEGSFIGFKKCRDDLIVKLEITEDAVRCSATGRKCRCSKAKVISITNLDGTATNVKTAISKYDPSFTYTCGEIIEVPNFNTNRWDECSAGIHFFITRQEAVDYNY